ncbi:Uma2 family endonuclease [Parageobacillus thermantarcticus]|uniref:Uma2 family endonuclease n=1 Tax=Parageobacillus thermantarcticus TaxID=186116 RepID=UPI001FC9263F|nr:Uma2 family endonuclease [Parageobacillus thermantarcticus]
MKKTESVSNINHNEKFYLYERFGVQEYWIVDLAHQTIEIYGLMDSKFSKRNVFGKNSTLTSFVFPELTIDLRNIFTS